MLLFIQEGTGIGEWGQPFKYISCYCLSVQPVSFATIQLHSNTSHVIVYRRSGLAPLGDSGIQIHLMLLFITIGIKIFLTPKNSNTSHVIVYLCGFDFLQSSVCHSNTSHVIVYLVPYSRYTGSISFKYISCYCLSQLHRRKRNNAGIQIHLMLLFIKPLRGIHPRVAHSNTSHVIVYQLLLLSVKLFLQFKYISCYCLSHRITARYLSISYSNTSHVIVYRSVRCKAFCYRTFKYISCYCLSSPRAKPWARSWYSNTSHVIVYPSAMSSQSAACRYSNTSHVIVYPLVRRLCGCRS